MADPEDRLAEILLYAKDLGTDRTNKALIDALVWQDIPYLLTLVKKYREAMTKASHQAMREVRITRDVPRHVLTLQKALDYDPDYEVEDG